MIEPRQILSLFIEYLNGTESAINQLAERLSEDKHPLAVITREIADAKADIPDDICTRTKHHTLSSGVGWRIEYMPSTGRESEHFRGVVRESQLVSIQIIWGDKGDWKEIEGIPNELAPSGPVTWKNSVVAGRANITRHTVENVFRSCLFNLLGGLLVGHQVAYASAGSEPIWIAWPFLNNRMKALTEVPGPGAQP